jgi:hypothetical protein
MGLAVVAAGAFGMAHNQLSYSVGPSYFTGFKFTQFAIPEDTAPRWGASLVGWQAGWWMGLIAGLPVLGYGLLRTPSAGALWAGGIGAILTVILTAATSALLGLALGFAAVASGLDFPAAAARPGVTPDDMIRAGVMHEASYYGGLLGALLAFWPMTRATKLTKDINP